MLNLTTICRSCFPPHLGLHVRLVKPDYLPRAINEDDWSYLGVFRTKQKDPLLMVTWGSDGDREWRDPFVGCCKSRRLRMRRFYRVHAEGANISCYTTTINRFEELPLGVSSELPSDLAVYAPVLDSSSNPILPAGADYRDHANLHLLSPEGYLRFITYVMKTRWVAGCSWLDTEDDILSGPLNSYPSSRQWVQSSDALENAMSLSLIGGMVGGSPSCSLTLAGEQLYDFPPRGSFGALPTEITLRILSYLRPRELRRFSRVSVHCNDLADTRLWRTYRVGGQTVSEVLARCEALIRDPRRASYVRRLIIGPWVLPWDPRIWDSFAQIWQNIPQLLDLVIEGPGDTRHKATEFGTLFRNLLIYGRHIHLRALHSHELLLPDSPLHLFLSQQSTIEELIDVDFSFTRVPSLGSCFLPLLKVLVCERPITAQTLLPGRPLDLLQIQDRLDPDEMIPLSDAVAQCPGSLREVGFSLLGPSRYDIEPFDKGLVGSFIESFSSTTHLRCGPRWIWDLDEPLPSTFSSVTEVEYQTQHSFVRTSQSVAEIATHIGPSVRTVLVCSEDSFYEEWHWTANDEFVAFSSLRRLVTLLTGIALPNIHRKSGAGGFYLLYSSLTRKDVRRDIHWCE